MWFSKKNRDASEVIAVLQRYEVLSARMSILSTMGADSAAVRRAFPGLDTIIDSSRGTKSTLMDAKVAVETGRVKISSVTGELKAFADAADEYHAYLDMLDNGKADGEKAFVARPGIAGAF